MVKYQEELIGEVAKSKLTTTKIRKMIATDDNGKSAVYIDIRDYDTSGKNAIPTKRGVTISPTNIDEVCKLLNEAGVKCGSAEQVV